MSETTSFLGGAAIAGLAVLVISRSGVNPSVPTPQPLPAPPLSSTVSVPSTPLSPTAYNAAPSDEAQRLMVDQLKSQVEQQKNETERLKDRLQKQQETIDNLTLQLRETSLSAYRSPQVGVAPEQSINPVLTGLLWALGGIVLTMGGGIVLVGLLLLFARQNQQNSRSVEVIQPLSPINTYIDPDQRYLQALPPRRMVRRTRNIDVQ